MSTENLYNDEAKKKLKELVTSIDFAMMETSMTTKPTHIIPMSTKKVDADGALWFLSKKDSEHNENIKADSDIQLIYAKAMAMEFMTVYGSASIVTDTAIIHELYSSSDDNWFEGKNDPTITAIKVTPKKAQYWDTKSGALVSLFKMGIGTITGKKQDLGVEGELSL